MLSPLTHRLQKFCTGARDQHVVRRCLSVAPRNMAGFLPALGNVLFMPVRRRDIPIEEMPEGLVVEAVKLAMLMQTRWFVTVSMISVDGPREWIECRDQRHRVCARLHLLPDTDYLAWDALLGCGEPKPSFPERLLIPGASLASAQILCFHGCHMAGLYVLGAEMARKTSSMSRDLAFRIARDEALALQPMASD